MWRESWDVREWCEDSRWRGKGGVKAKLCLDKQGVMVLSL